MYRFIEKELKTWRQDKEPIPLLLRGARQVGKSFVVEKFAKENFDNYISINFELEEDLKEYFEILDPKIIIEKLSTLKGTKVEAGKTLLFLDEIQLCPKAILALRYFHEKMPAMHIIGAGSLLDFALREAEISLPVGRVQFLYMQPMSFYEYLHAAGLPHYIDYLQSFTLEQELDTVIHKALLEEIRRYFILGGMPKVLKTYFESVDFSDSFKVQERINQVYKADFGKYASIAKKKYLDKVFAAIPKMVKDKFKYSVVDADIRSANLKEALDLLCHARVATKVKSTSGAGLPFEAEASEKHFKALFLDIGLMQKMLGMDTGISKAIVEANDFHSIAAGALAEQFVGQEILACQSLYSEKNLYYWQRKTGLAEVDYLISVDAQVAPLEVKAGKTGRLKSLRLFMEKYKSPLGIRVSQKGFSFEDQILSVPLYAIAELERLAQECL